MSKSLTNTTQRHRSKLALALMAGGIVAGCGGNDPVDGDGDGFDGLGETTFPLLQNVCTFAGSTMTLKVRNGETLYFTLRPDGKVLAGALTAGGSDCTALVTDKIAVTEDPAATGTETVFLDYIGGYYALGTISGSTPTPGITLALGAGTGGVGSAVVVRGSLLADKIYLGSTYVASTTTLAFNWINVNGDLAPDVRMTGVTDIKLSTGPGADIVSADGANGTTGTALDATVTFSAYGGADADILTGGKGPSLLYGGDGDDKFPQTATAGPDNIVGGKGTDTVDYSTRVTPVTVTVCSTCASDPCTCTATDAACKATTDSTQDGCITTAGTDLTACNTLVNDAWTSCTGLCDPTDTVCTGDCDATQASDLAACAQTKLDDLALCQMGRDSRCDGFQTTCQTTCAANDGAANEHDNIDLDVEIVLGGKAGDTIDATYAACSNQATPTAVVKCTLTGNDGDDTIIGSPYKDLIDGGAGNDTLQGGLGDDTFIGGAGNDTVSYADRAFSSPVWVSLSPDPLNLWIAGRNGATGELDVIPLDVENLIGGAGPDKLRGNLSDNVIQGGAGDDTIEGGAGNDSLSGGLGNDTIYGGAGNDLLFGGGGTDSLYGGDGEDFLDATDSTPLSDPFINCDGPNASGGGNGTSPGGNDSVVKDHGAGIDVNVTNCDTVI